MANKRGSNAHAAKRRLQALDLRAAGATYRQIATELKCSAKTAFYDVDEALAEAAREQHGKAERVRDIELRRLDRATLGVWPQVKNGDPAAVRALMQIMERRAKLLGLDAPTGVELKTPDGTPVSFTLDIGAPRSTT